MQAVRLEPHVDHRGSLFEIVNFDHPFWQEPVVYAYAITIRPGRIKGWGMHKLQTDRYADRQRLRPRRALRRPHGVAHARADRRRAS